MTDAWASYLDERRNRGFGDILAVSGQTESRAASGLHAGAENLVTKALRALEEGDEERAVRYTSQASRLPWDAHEEVWPGALATHFALFEELSEAMEDAEDGDTRWIDDAVTVLGEVSGEPREHLARTLGIFGRDATIDLSSAEAKKIHRAVGRDPLDVEFGTDPTETPEQLLPRMLDLLRVTNRYHLVHVHGQ
ncbi:hypothetical protein N864_01050 [Intrasporangium chromatireducens Q5-1]|uniref:Uncharacterized protein n=1 Tax=Intrasporangium chromatireducens Q5-1 TaxID=584657 RepID=W9GN65_9MICO|nr:hypothetical protein [Intrasporangium chromatireducens]EWT07716.1 hypothetical protein N864_01050 [Intrasporangium chromatireducens Q5-1]